MTQEDRNNHVFVIAEIGSNHCMQFDLALNLITLAKEAGADAAKFQLYRADDLAKRRNAQDYWPLYKMSELPDSWLPQLKSHCDNLGIEFMCTAYSEWAVEAVAPFVSKFKIASFEMNDHNLLAYIRGYCENHSKKVVLSTGMATAEEVVKAVSVIDPDNIAYLLHCASAYPCPPEDANLKVINRYTSHLMRALESPASYKRAGPHDYPAWHNLIGLSDHTLGITAPVAAVALGATAIEKHMTSDKNRVGPDHAFAVEPAEFKRMVEMIRETEVMLGDGIKSPRPSEELMRKYRVGSKNS